MRLKELIDVEGLVLLTEAGQVDLEAPILSPHLHGLGSIMGPGRQFPQQGLVFFLSGQEAQSLCRSDQLFDRLQEHRPAALVVGGSRAEAQVLLDRCSKSGLMLLGTNTALSSMEVKLETILFSRVKNRISLHGVLVLLWGQGLLILGASGAGKTDVALELIRRGHQLVADDAVELFCPEPAVVWGRPLKGGSHPMVVYGVGLMRAEHVWGAAAVANHGPIGQVIELLDFSSRSYENPLEAGGQTLYLMGVAVPYLAFDQERRPHLATLVEVAIRQRLSQKEMKETVSVGDEHG